MSKMPSADERLDAQLLQELDNLIDLCEEGVTKSATSIDGSAGDSSSSDDDEDLSESTGVAEHARRVALKTNQHVDVAGVMSLNETYRKEATAVNELQTLLVSRALDADTRAPIPVLEGGWNLRQIQQGPDLTKADYFVIAQGLKEKIIHDFECCAKFAGMIQMSLVLPGSDLPHHAEEVLETFFKYYGAPNRAELFNLSISLHLPSPFLDEFFQRKLKITENTRVARGLPRFKKLMRSVDRRGLLKKMEESEREKWLQRKLDMVESESEDSEDEGMN